MLDDSSKIKFNVSFCSNTVSMLHLCLKWFTAWRGGIRFLCTHFSIFWIILKGMHVFFYWLNIQGLDSSFLKLETVLKFKIFIAYLYCIDNNAKVKSLHLLNVSMAGSITPVLYLLNRLLRSGNKSRQLKENFHNNITIGDNSDIWFYADISCFGGVFAKNTSRKTKNFPSQMAREI